jgi:hypothetical protein
MSYRKITVAGVVHEYVIGSTHTKIKGLGIFDNDKIGVRSEYSGRPKWQKGSTTEAYKKMVVTPAIVADIIAGRPIRPMSSCEHGTVTSRSTGDPYAAEIHDLDESMIDCKKCVHEMAMEI